MSKENFWEKLRQRAGLTQEGFARKMDRSVDTVRGWEGGRYNPSPASATKAAQIGGITPLTVLVGHEIHSATKNIARGSITPTGLLGKAEDLALLATKADDKEDADILAAAAEELRTMAGELTRISNDLEPPEEPESAKKSQDTDFAEGRTGRDAFGRKASKLFNRRLGTDILESAEKSERPDDRGRDLTGHSSKKLFGRNRR